MLTSTPGPLSPALPDSSGPQTGEREGWDGESLFILRSRVGKEKCPQCDSVPHQNKYMQL